MSTTVTPSNSLPLTVDKDEPVSNSFRGLRRKLEGLREVPSLDEINAWLLEVEVRGEDLRPYVGFKAGTYARHRVFRNEHAELLVLCWRPGQRTPIHDHNGSHGAVRVCEGVMWETMFALNEKQELYYQAAREWNGGGVTGADVPDIHQLGNPEVSGRNLVTLHLYAPPLGVLNTYKVGSSEVGHYTPDQFMDGAGI
ncbi:MAG TPA: cysteine dioxygenase family protein [Pyrinomonadaceae bacterium]|jgi:cysteine dioxygenase|nr:cysteine dioxygenase family protein [Pyrinomonadaceae bacterium]